MLSMMNKMNKIHKMSKMCQMSEMSKRSEMPEIFKMNSLVCPKSLSSIEKTECCAQITPKVVQKFHNHADWTKMLKQLRSKTPHNKF